VSITAPVVVFVKTTLPVGEDPKLDVFIVAISCALSASPNEVRFAFSSTVVTACETVTVCSADALAA
jgi:hypothetical protein